MEPQTTNKHALDAEEDVAPQAKRSKIDEKTQKELSNMSNDELLNWALENGQQAREIKREREKEAEKRAEQAAWLYFVKELARGQEKVTFDLCMFSRPVVLKALDRVNGRVKIVEDKQFEIGVQIVECQK